MYKKTVGLNGMKIRYEMTERIEFVDGIRTAAYGIISQMRDEGGRLVDYNSCFRVSDDYGTCEKLIDEMAREKVTPRDMRDVIKVGCK